MALVVSRYHREITDALRSAALGEFDRAEGNRNQLLIVPAPGAFELTSICRAAAMHQSLDAIVALGCVITGETPHDQYICQSLVQGFTLITVQSGTPIAFGVLTCRTFDQARARAGGSAGNKGAEAMIAAIEAANAVRLVKRWSP